VAEDQGIQNRGALMQIRVYYEDTDCGNVVYYANYLKYMERSRTEFLRDRGIDIAAYHDQGKMFAVIEAHVFYKVPAKYNDLLEVDSCIKEITATTIRFTTAIRNGTGSLLVDQWQAHADSRRDPAVAGIIMTFN
jgi:acyl-CoA thioester hydrolase